MISKRRILLSIAITSLILIFLTISQPASAQNNGKNPFKSADTKKATRVEQALGKVSNLLSDGASNSAINMDETKKKQNLETELLKAPGNRYIVKFLNTVSLETIYDIVSRYNYNIIGDSEQRLFMIKITNKKNFDQITEGLLEYSQEDKKNQVHVIPNDTYYNQQWSLNAVNLPNGWDISKGSDTVYVAVIDSGVYREHPDFSNTDIRAGYDVIFDDYVDWDSTGHGTNVTGVIAASTNNEKGIAGVTWNVAVVPFRVVYSSGTIYSSDVITAIYAAADVGCDVISCSLGGSTYDVALNSAIQYAISKGCIVVASAGNYGNSSYIYPASYNGVISVGAIDSNLSKSYFSQYNNQIDCVAPGSNIFTTSYWLDSGEEQYDYDYEHVSGTSFSAPIVSGIAALCRSLNPSITPADFNLALKKTCTDLGAIGYDTYYGNGLINAEAILKYFNPVTSIGTINGTATVDSLLTAGTLTPADATVTYQWMRATTLTGSYTTIVGATENTYQLTLDDLSKYIKVTANGSGNYSGTVTSIAAGPVKSSIKGIGEITGTTQVYSTLTAGDVSPSGATVTYQWAQSDAKDGIYTNIIGATKKAYTLTTANLNKYIRVTVTGTGIYTDTATSNPITDPVNKASLTSIGTIAGTTRVGSTLAAGILTPSAATVTYQWQSADHGNDTYTNITGATAKTYLLKITDIGKDIRVVVTGTGYYTGIVTSNVAGPITTVVTTIGAITGTAAVDSTLTAGALTPAGATATYQWMRANTSTGIYTPIVGATENIYQLTLDDLGKYIKVTATGSGNYSGTVTSIAAGPVRSKP